MPRAHHRKRITGRSSSIQSRILLKVGDVSTSIDGGDRLHVIVRRVPAGSIAARIGLKPSDAIESIDGKPATPTLLRQAAKAIVPGGKLKLGVRRKDGTSEVLDLEFEAPDADTPADDDQK